MSQHHTYQKIVSVFAVNEILESLYDIVNNICTVSVLTSPQNLNFTAASSLHTEISHRECFLAAVEDFSPQPSSNPVDFSDSVRDEREEEEPLDFGVRPYV